MMPVLASCKMIGSVTDTHCYHDTQKYVSQGHYDNTHNKVHHGRDTVSIAECR